MPRHSRACAHALHTCTHAATLPVSPPQHAACFALSPPGCASISHPPARGRRAACGCAAQAALERMRLGAMQARHSYATEAHAHVHDLVAVTIDGGAYEPQRAPASQHHRARGKGDAAHQLLRRRDRLALALFCIALLAVLLLLRVGRGDCSSSASLRALEAALAAGARPVPGANALRDLIVVAGHAVFIGDSFADPADTDAWYLEEYQRVPGQVDTFLEHMRAGVEAAAANPAALLLFSGGATRAQAGPLSEGASYWAVTNAARWFDAPQVRDRAFTEEHARDSYENLLFSLCRFHEITGAWPRNLTVVGYEFKRTRFESLHRRAVSFPAARFSYIGTRAASAAAALGEAAAAAAFQDDPYGCGGALGAKRHARDPFARGVPYVGRCAAAHDLLTHCGPAPFLGRLPWEDAGGGAGVAAGGMGGGVVGTLAAAAEALDGSAW